MADHYRILGVTKNATKEEIKGAFRKLAIQFHPDKHVQSPKSSRDALTLKFKQVSEAYEVLIDDRKRAAYNISRSSGGGSSSNSYNSNYYYGGSSYYKNSQRSSGSYSRNANRFALNFEVFLRYMTTRAFFLNATFAGLLLGGTIAVDISRETLWKMYNPGKSFEEAMESIEKNKASKGKQ